MNGFFEVKHFLSRKWLQSMAQGEERTLPEHKCSYTSIRCTCSQLKKMGRGVWKVSKKGNNGKIRITRIS